MQLICPSAWPGEQRHSESKMNHVKKILHKLTYGKYAEKYANKQLNQICHILTTRLQFLNELEPPGQGREKTTSI